jgi:hypothetical protein
MHSYSLTLLWFQLKNERWRLTKQSDRLSHEHRFAGNLVD